MRVWAWLVLSGPLLAGGDGDNAWNGWIGHADEARDAGLPRSVCSAWGQGERQPAGLWHGAVIATAGRGGQTGRALGVDADGSGPGMAPSAMAEMSSASAQL